MAKRLEEYDWSVAVQGGPYTDDQLSALAAHVMIGHSEDPNSHSPTYWSKVFEGEDSEDVAEADQREVLAAHLQAISRKRTTFDDLNLYTINSARRGGRLRRVLSKYLRPKRV